MNNPWLKKNPFLSMWLSGANAVAGHARNAAKRQGTDGLKTATRAVWDAWLPAPAAAPAAKPKRRR